MPNLKQTDFKDMSLMVLRPKPDGKSMALNCAIENATGSDHEDAIVGNDLDNTLIGEGGLTRKNGADDDNWRNAA